MDDLSHAEGLLRESFDATTRVNLGYGPTEDEGQTGHAPDGRTREGKRLAHLNEKNLPEKKRILRLVTNRLSYPTFFQYDTFKI